MHYPGILPLRLLYRKGTGLIRKTPAHAPFGRIHRTHTRLFAYQVGIIRNSQLDLLSKSQEFRLDNVIFQLTHLVRNFIITPCAFGGISRHFVTHQPLFAWNSGNNC